MLALVVGRDHRFARCESIGVGALNDESMVLPTTEFATCVQIDRYFRQIDPDGGQFIERGHRKIVRRTCLATLLPTNIASDRGDLAAIKLIPSGLRRTAVLLRRKGAYRTVAARAFIELVHACRAGKR